MSAWTYVNGVLTVKTTDSMSQADMQYQVYKTLEHLPIISGSESNLKPYIIQKNGTNGSCNCDEYGQHSNLGNGHYNLFDYQDEYIVVLNESLRDRKLEETYKETIKWLTRLSKRIWVKDVLIQVSGYDKNWDFKGISINPNNDLIFNLYECPYNINRKKHIKNKNYWFGNWAGNAALEKWYYYGEDDNYGSV